MSINGKAESNNVLHGNISSLNVMYIDAYAVAVRNGFKGTEEEWLNSLSENAAAEVEKDLEENTEYIFNGGDASGKVSNAIYEDDIFPGSFYRLVDGEREWFNPPIQADTEYRTIERIGDKPVYTFSHKLTWFGGQKMGFIDPFNGAKINIRRASCSINNYALPLIVTNSEGAIDTEQSAWVNVNFSPTSDNLLNIQLNGKAVEGKSGYVRIWYTKQ